VPGGTVVAVPVPPRPPWRLVVLSTVLALLAATATYVALADDDGDDGPPLGTVQLDEVPEPDKAAFSTFDGVEVPLSSLRGGPTVVNFFASYCVPCIEEMPALEEVHLELADQVAFLGLAVADDAGEAHDLVERTGVTYPTAQDTDSAVITALGGTVLPTTVLLDVDGAVVATKHGELDADELRAMIEDELGIST